MIPIAVAICAGVALGRSGVFDTKRKPKKAVRGRGERLRLREQPVAGVRYGMVSTPSCDPAFPTSAEYVDRIPGGLWNAAADHAQESGFRPAVELVLQRISPGSPVWPGASSSPRDLVRWASALSAIAMEVAHRGEITMHEAMMVSNWACDEVVRGMGTRRWR